MAAKTVTAGGIIAYPTEAVWGLGCHPDNEIAVRRLRQLKQRDPGKGLILVAANQSQFKPWLQGLTSQQQQQLAASWPGPNTWLVPCRASRPWLTGSFNSIALRVSAHPLVIALCERLGHPLVSTSANPAGRLPARQAKQVRAYFANQVDYLLAGATLGAPNPSTIRDLSSGKLVRAG